MSLFCRRTAFATVALATLYTICPQGLAEVAVAQELPRLAVGDRVRVMIVDSDKWTLGSLASISAERMTLVSESADTPIAILLVSVSELQVSKGRQSNIGGGALVGAVVGGLMVGVMQECQSGGDLCSLERGASLLAGGIFGGLFGALLGAAVRTEKWEGVPVERLRTLPGAMPIPDPGPGVSLVISGKAQL